MAISEIWKLLRDELKSLIAGVKASEGITENDQVYWGKSSLWEFSIKTAYHMVCEDTRAP